MFSVFPSLISILRTGLAALGIERLTFGGHGEQAAPAKISTLSLRLTSSNENRIPVILWKAAEDCMGGALICILENSRPARRVRRLRMWRRTASSG